VEVQVRKEHPVLQKFMIVVLVVSVKVVDIPRWVELEKVERRF
jgi:hypothetical protein